MPGIEGAVAFKTFLGVVDVFAGATHKIQPKYGLIWLVLRNCLFLLNQITNGMYNSTKPCKHTGNLRLQHIDLGLGFLHRHTLGRFNLRGSYEFL